jgi:hypothetical protein
MAKEPSGEPVLGMCFYASWPKSPTNCYTSEITRPHIENRDGRDVVLDI